MIAPWTLVLMLNWSTGTAAVQIPMADKATCHLAAVAALEQRDSVRRVFCLRSGHEEKQ